MKIKIENFGPVNEFKFDTEKVFHLIVGDNNVGKSYALTAYYFVVKSLLDIVSARNINRGIMFFSQITEEDSEVIDSNEVRLFIASLEEKKNGDIDISQLYKFLSIEFLQQTLASEFSKRIKSSYNELGSIVNSFSENKSAKITIEFGGLTITLAGNVEEFKVTDAKFKHDAILRLSKQNRQTTIIHEKLVIYKHTSETVEDSLSKIRQQCVSRCLSFMRDAVGSIIDIDYLPASRSGLYQALSAFGQIIAELSKSRSFLSSKVELPGISGQLSDYFIKLTSIKASEPNLDETFSKVATRIEESVLNGKIEYDFKEKKLYYRPTGTELRLDLSATSSMVSETAPIVAYIRHIIAWNTAATTLTTKLRRTRIGPHKPLKKILIIEEPEAHLHPANQIKMTQIYTDLANIGVNIVMTSHSNYVFNKLSNLVIEKKLAANDVQCDLFKMKDKGSIGESQCIDDYGIDDKNFTDASEELLNERLGLLNNMDV